MANIIIPNSDRKADTMHVAKKYGVDLNNPAMREAAEITAARSREAIQKGQNRRSLSNMR